MKFLESGIVNLVSNTLTQRAPLYVQYYISARCNLRCEQCNVIYANADRRELNTAESFRVIDNLADLGASVVLLTGGEPFIRNDLPDLAGRLVSRGVHPRIQTNGLATIDGLRRCAELGVRDISISLDSLEPANQDFLNGGFDDSWNTAVETIANVGQVMGTNTFAAFGCVFSPFNFQGVPDVIRFATELGWWVSLVPAHSTDPLEPRSFSTFNQTVQFQPNQYSQVDAVLDEIGELKSKGFNIYDSEQYLKDLRRFVKGEPLTWRDRNAGVCDAGSLYFAVLPDGGLAPCCDWRLEEHVDVGGPDFVKEYKRGNFVKPIQEKSKACSGCLYGSYPEITISARFAKASLERYSMFIAESRSQINTISADEIRMLAKKHLSGKPRS
ncbi:MAG: radical SAM protein [Actinobacteria bacterium]|nr:radical SAM protein [Actinomycetota bacterium]